MTVARANRTVFKYELDIDPPHNPQVVMLPECAKVLSVQIQNEIPTIWALVDPDLETTPRKFLIAGTGWPIPGGVGHLTHLSTVQDGPFVWHVFEVDA